MERVLAYRPDTGIAAKLLPELFLRRIVVGVGDIMLGIILHLRHVALTAAASLTTLI